MTLDFIKSSQSLYRSISSPAPNSSQDQMSKRLSNRLSLNRNSSSAKAGGGGGFLSSWSQRLFLATVLIEFIIIITFISILVRDPFWRQHLDNFTRVQYAVLCSIVFLCLDALRSANIVQVVSVSAFNIPILFYSIFQRVNAFDAFFNEKDSNGKSSPCGGEAGWDAEVGTPCRRALDSYNAYIGLLTAAPIVIGLAQVSYVWFSYKLAKEFGWVAFRNLGGDLGLKRMNDWDLRLSTLFKVNVFFTAIYAIYSTIFAVQTLRDTVRPLASSTRSLIIFAMVIQYVLLLTPLLAIWALMKEHRVLMYITLAWLLVGTSILIPLTFTQVYAPRKKWDWYTQTTDILRIVLAVINALLTLTTVGLGIFVAVRQFGSGLKESREAATVNASTPRGQYFDEEAGDGEGAELGGLGGGGKRVIIE
ncbi:hypothetical protein BDY24DRAFT_417735 [Mrakia frigida]|uniref:uncharacterized protein n=1 Tax=Mrakia frigida TaxID=29902 RepID=UPI003FCBFC33